MNLNRSGILVDPDVFKKVYLNCHQKVFSYVFFLVENNQLLAEDITADTFLKAWNARKTFKRKEDEVIYWLLTIAKRLVIDHYRKKRIHRGKLDFLTIRRENEANTSSPLQELEMMERKEQVKMLLKQLSQEDQEILVLRYWLDWKVREIANFLQLKENTISVRIRRSLNRILEYSKQVDF